MVVREGNKCLLPKGKTEMYPIPILKLKLGFYSEGAISATAILFSVSLGTISAGLLVVCFNTVKTIELHYTMIQILIIMLNTQGNIQSRLPPTYATRVTRSVLLAY